MYIKARGRGYSADSKRTVYFQKKPASIWKPGEHKGRQGYIQNIFRPAPFGRGLDAWTSYGDDVPVCSSNEILQWNISFPNSLFYCKVKQ